VTRTPISDTIPPEFETEATRKNLDVKPEEIEQRFLDAGWELDGSFEGYLLIGHDGERVSIMAHREHWGTDELTYELLDHEQMATYWVEEVPNPQQAAKLLEEHGQIPETWDMP
jgi:hypothetical protein